MKYFFALRYCDSLDYVLQYSPEVKNHEYDPLGNRNQDQGRPESSRDEPDSAGPASKQDAPHDPEI